MLTQSLSRRSLSIRSFLLATSFAAAVILMGRSTVMAQGASDEEEPPKPGPVELTTRDGVILTATWYPSRKEKGKDATPVILLHMLRGNRGDYHALAERLHQKGDGCAVLVPDLRGHGESTRVGARGATLKATSLSRPNFTAMVTSDMQRLKSFLVEKNNAGELNIEKLVIVGAEMGASVALNWARFDWSMPPQGNRKQGQDVKLLVLISPEWATKGLPLRTAMTSQPLTTMVYDPQLKAALRYGRSMNFSRPVPLDFRREVTTLIIVGKGKSSALSDAKRLHSMLKPFHPGTDEDKSLFWGEMDTTLQGTKIFGVAGLKLAEHTAKFIENQSEKRKFRWAERKNPYQ